MLPCEVACKHFSSGFCKIGFIISNYRKQKNGVTKHVKGRAISWDISMSKNVGDREALYV
ncbi:hypothetical protein C0R09_14645 [Brevibacillus laterosporus]|nr:hypothetical protein C0R09_14645 [Brevibacillus laterosporus]